MVQNKYEKGEQNLSNYCLDLYFTVGLFHKVRFALHSGIVLDFLKLYLRFQIFTQYYLVHSLSSILLRKMRVFMQMTN